MQFLEEEKDPSSGLDGLSHEHLPGAEHSQYYNKSRDFSQRSTT
jgi:hypothetical protein